MYDSARPDQARHDTEAMGRAYNWRTDAEWMTESEIEREIAAAGFSSRGQRDESRPDRMLGIVLALIGIIAVVSVLAACGAVR